MAIKAIDTRYRGYRFRSRLEARWAVFLDELSLEWEYEPEGYELPSGNYLCDFWLPGWQAWLEIKPVSPTQPEKTSCEELAWATDRPVMVGVNLPTRNPVMLFVGDITPSGCGGTGWHSSQFAVAAKTGVICLDVEPADRKFYSPQLQEECLFIASVCSLFAPNGSMPISAAADAAKSARFEFGQTPRRTQK